MRASMSPRPGTMSDCTRRRRAALDDGQPPGSRLTVSRSSRNTIPQALMLALRMAGDTVQTTAGAGHMGGALARP